MCCTQHLSQHFTTVHISILLQGTGSFDCEHYLELNKWGLLTAKMEVSAFPSTELMWHGGGMQQCLFSITVYILGLYCAICMFISVFVLSMCLQESVDKTYLFECMMTLPVDVEKMRASFNHPASQSDTDGGPDEATGVTVQQLFSTGALTDRPARGMWADNKQSKANFLKKMSVSESAAMADL